MVNGIILNRFIQRSISPGIILLTAILLHHCTDTQVAGGFGSETTNGIVGSVHNSDDTPAAGAVIRLFPDDYDPVTGKNLGTNYVDTADEKGTYRFSRIASGNYTVVGRNRKAATGFLAGNVRVRDDSVTTAPRGTLNKTGSITADFSSGGMIREGYVYIPGTDISSSIESDEPVFLSDVPAGTYAVVMLGSEGSEKRNVLRDEITVDTTDTVTIIRPLWNYSRRLFLNTTAAGADVQGDIYGFPVLVRLNNDNLDFSQARTDGSDLLFTTSGNTVLPHEIERWDPVTELAEVWVKVDTIRGNNGTQSITMYWGNSAAAGGSSSAEVFDTIIGFQGVWHLAESANSNSFDATANRYHGTPSDTAPLPVQGVIGNAKEFNGISSGIRMEGTAVSTLNFNENDRYTLSAWVYSDTIDEKWHFIAGKGQTQYYLKQQIGSKYGNWEFVEFHDRAAWQMTITPAVTRTWKLLTGVRDGDRQYLYLDGELIDSTIKQNTDAETISRNISEDFTIGRHQEYVSYSDQGYCFFDGQIDEVRISNVVRSVDWIRLCYMNQREDDKLVRF